MTHANPRPDWEDFYDEGLGPLLPLTSGQKVQYVSGVLPSGESNSFDFRQSGVVFPYPNQGTEDEYAFTSDVNPEDFPDQFSSGWWDASGILKTYGEAPSGLRESGIFNFHDLISRFSNATEVDVTEIEDFEIFGSYIHHERLPSNAKLGTVNSNSGVIPFLATSRAVIDFDAYGGWEGFGGPRYGFR